MNAHQHSDRPEPSPGGLMADMLGSVLRLVQGELALLRAEAQQRAQSAQKAVLLVLLAALLGVTALNVLAGAAVAGVVALGLAPHWATLVVGAVLVILAVVLGLRAAAMMRAATSGKSAAATNIKRDVATLQTLVKSNATA